ncbi:MAG: aspartate kinase [Xanthomonadales bacterium]|nr:aspartate kinase [Gammaproteobacteria bacterium]MBT8054679.1 aspartate kinase [Gammaproteobacteria bacterium]NND55769.1 aspartate kinase [Xanthomonadales bacterium]NNK50180.1 aspartate kinase [Xanthomonadales bacterium]
MADNWIVLKFGGTSVAGRSQWETIASLAHARVAAGNRVLLVCSAVAGVTNQLSALAYKPDSARRLEQLIKVHRELGAALGVHEQNWFPESQGLLEQCLHDLSHDPGPEFHAALLAMGEWLSTKIGCCFLRQTLDAGWVDAREALEVVPEEHMSPARQWLSATCSAAEAPGLAGRWSALSPVLVTQGFVAKTKDGRTALLGRGGSDTSAALLAGRLSAEKLEIWTDVPGLFTADPRLIGDARLLAEIDYSEALEMAASGAKVVHPRAIRAAAATGTSVEIRDLNRTGMMGTRIGQKQTGQGGVKTVTCQKGMAVLLLQNLDARFHVGFLAGVFEVFRHRGISIDLVATSETTTTVAVNSKANHLGDDELNDLVEDLGSRCKVTLYRDCVCVNLVGRGVRTALSRLQGTMEYFEEHPLLMVSQSANDLCLSLLVNSGDHETLLKNAHRALIPLQDPSGGDKSDGFGASWSQIQRLADGDDA